MNLMLRTGLCVGLLAVPQSVLGADYTMDATSSELYVQVFKDPDTLGAGLSHDHVIQAAGWNGSISWDSADPSSCAIVVSVPVNRLVVDEPSLRQRVGYDTTLSDSQREDVRGKMIGDGQLDGATYPLITFRSTSCNSDSITGDLSIHGVAKSVTMAATIAADDANFSASGQLSIRASQFGFQPFSALMGQLKNRDDMLLHIKLVGTTGG